MVNSSKVQALPRYLLLGVVTITVLLLAAVASHFIYKNQRESEVSFSALEQEFMQKGRDQLVSEMKGAKDYISYMVNQAETVLKEQSREEVLKAHKIAETIYNREIEHHSPAEVAELIKETLRDIRFFNGRGYIFIDDMQGNCVLLPTSPQVEGRSLYNNQDDTGHFIMRGLLDAVDNPGGGGYSRYRWYPPHDQTHMEDKIAFVKEFKPLNWVIGAGDYLYQIENDMKVQALQRLKSISFGDHGYLSIFDEKGRLLATPGVSSLHGAFKDPKTSQLEQTVIAQIRQAAEKGGGFIEYDWFFPNGEGPFNKISLVDRVPGLNWILVAGFYPEDVKFLLSRQQTLLSERQREDRAQLYVFLILATIITLSLAFAFSQWLNQKFTEYSSEIEQNQKDLELKADQLQLASRVFDTASEGIMVTSTDNRILAVNDAFVDISGYSSAEVIGRNPRFLQSGQHDETFYHTMWTTLQTQGKWSGEIWNRRKNGELFPQWLAINASRDEKGQVRNYIASITDLTERKEVEEKLRYLSDYDPLTSLPNRRLLGYRVEQTITMSRNQDQQQFALIFIDLDNFKTINDSLGHSFGDQILQIVARRIAEVVGEGDTVSRLGGDEFMVLTTELEQPEQAADLAQKISDSVSAPLENDSHLMITPSVGIAMYPNDGDNFDKLLRNADAAVHFAKQEGRNNYQFYAAEMNLRASERLQVEIALRKAIENNEFEVHYQPQICLQREIVIGCEALVRWRHPQLGLVPPNSFIPLAEETGLILQIGGWVLRESCRQGALWLQQSEHEFTMSVNVSVRQFRPELVEEVRSALEVSGLPARALVIEITESTLMQDEEKTLGLLHELKALGVQLSLDDFGTGYSSMAYLKRFNLDQLKIDRAFIADLPHNQDDAAITSAIIDVANHFGLITVAEGVETAQQAQFLADVGCIEGQGYLYEKPLQAEIFEERYFSG